jgi:hypothetical protein
VNVIMNLESPLKGLSLNQLSFFKSLVSKFCYQTNHLKCLLFACGYLLKFKIVVFVTE